MSVIVPVLPTRHMDLLTLLAEGYKRADMARHLGVTERTVIARLRTLYANLGVHDRAAAVAVGYRSGILPPHSGPVSAQVDALPAANPPAFVLAKAREDAGVTQGAMATKLGISRSALSLKENGRVRFTVGEVRRCVDLLGVDLGGPA